MTPERLAELKALAEKAASAREANVGVEVRPGVWSSDPKLAENEGDALRALCAALDPETVLALVAAAERAETERGRILAELRRMNAILANVDGIPDGVRTAWRMALESIERDALAGEDAK